jgi:hypothetical protein
MKTRLITVLLLLSTQAIAELNVPYQQVQPVQSLSDSVGKWQTIANQQQQGNPPPQSGGRSVLLTNSKYQKFQQMHQEQQQFERPQTQ